MRRRVYNWILLPIIGIILFFITFLPLPDLFKLKMNTVCSYTLISPIDVKLKDGFNYKYEKIYVYDLSRVEKILSNLRDLLDQYLNIKGIDLGENKEKIIRKIYEDISYFLYQGVVEDSVLYNRKTIKVKVGDTLLNVDVNLLGGKREVIKKIADKYGKYLPGDGAGVLFSFLSYYIKPSVYYSPELTRGYFLSSNHAITISKGEKICDKGDRVSEDIISKINYINKSIKRRYFSEPLSLILRFLFILTGMSIVWMYIYKRKNNIFTFTNMLTIGFFMIFIYITGRFLFLFSPAAIPFVFISTIFVFLYGVEISFLISLFLCYSFFWGIPGYEFIPFIFMIPIMALLIVSFYVSEKKDIYKVILAGFSGIVASGLLMLKPLSQIHFGVMDFFYFSVSNLIYITLGFITLPTFEKITGIYTSMTIIEIGNLNKPLLRELSLKAHGTYHHSILVGLLAEAAAREIGADFNLARVGGYYHDIGKMKRPEYFIENQTGMNPHKALSYKMSALVIISHVKDGVEIGKKYGLPTPIIDIIAQHHGTTFLESFYKKAISEGKEIDEIDFRYPGPKPRTREAAVVMIADTVEAAIRAEKQLKPSRLIDVISSLIKAKMDDGQFEYVDLTMSDIKKIQKVFFNMMIGLHHTRIPY